MHRLSKTVVLLISQQLCTQHAAPTNRNRAPTEARGLTAAVSTCIGERRGSPDAAAAATKLLLRFWREPATPAATGRRRGEISCSVDAAASALSRAAGSSRLNLPLPTGSGFDLVVGLRSAA